MEISRLLLLPTPPCWVLTGMISLLGGDTAGTPRRRQGGFQGHCAGSEGTGSVLWHHWPLAAHQASGAVPTHTPHSITLVFSENNPIVPCPVLEPSMLSLVNRRSAIHTSPRDLSKLPSHKSRSPASRCPRSQALPFLRAPHTLSFGMGRPLPRTAHHKLAVCSSRCLPRSPI